jgi:hypothetical protein
MYTLSEMGTELIITKEDDIDTADKSQVFARQYDTEENCWEISEYNFPMVYWTWDDLEEAVDSGLKVYRSNGLNGAFIAIPDADNDDINLVLSVSDEWTCLGEVDSIEDWSTCHGCGAPARHCHGEWC